MCYFKDCRGQVSRDITPFPSDSRLFLFRPVGNTFTSSVGGYTCFFQRGWVFLFCSSAKILTCGLHGTSNPSGILFSFHDPTTVIVHILFDKTIQYIFYNIAEEITLRITFKMSKQIAAPLLALRMKPSRCLPPSGSTTDLKDKVTVMILQEDTPHYKCRDYLLRRKLESREPSTKPTENEVDTLCREKMCEWCYRVVDHFHASRDIVGIAFSFLDRFVDRCSCDRTAFKLSAMTCLYVAIKLFHTREVSMASLSELSRGEFDVVHIAEMEGIILQTLNWRMHPPTTQCFINLLQGLLPTLDHGLVTKAVYQRATFFAELSLFDYCFVTQPRSAIAIAALLNAMEGMEESVVSRDDHKLFLKAVTEAVGMEYPPERMESIRNRLWYVYSQSAQYQEDEVPSSEDPLQLNSHLVEKNALPGGDQSPVCVSNQKPSR